MKRVIFIICILFFSAAAQFSAGELSIAGVAVEPYAGISLNKAVFGKGDRMVVTLTTTAAGGNDAMNVYAALFLPDGTYYFLRDFPSIEFSRDSGPLLASPVTSGTYTLLDMVLPEGLPAGSWTWAAALAKPDWSEASEISWAPFEISNPDDKSWESPFGFHPASVYKPGYDNNGYGDAQNIGIRWTRDGVYALWFLVQPDLTKQEYDFSRYDKQWGRVPAGMHILGNIAPQGNIDEGYCMKGSYLPVDKHKYLAFVRAVVERYDGDGIDDMPGLVNPIKYWQVGNEPNGLKPGFAELQRITYTAIKEACPDCRVLIGGVPGMPPADRYIANFDKEFKPILDALGGKYVDIMDFHWYGNAAGDYKGAKDAYDHIKSVLREDGFPDIPFWITEMGAYSGDPVTNGPLGGGIDFPFQTERQQALDYVKRFVYPLSFGVKKIFPAFGLMEGFKYDGGYFDYTGLICDGWGPYDRGLGVKKLGYYAYKKMTEILEGSDWDRVQTLRDSDDLHVVRFERDTGPVWVAWDDATVACITTPCGRQVTIPGIDAAAVRVTESVPGAASGRDVTDYATAFHSTIMPVSGGEVAITLGDVPVFMEALP